MNYRVKGDYSIILMSLRENAPYEDRVADDGTTIYYEGHDVGRTKDVPDPKSVDQPEYTPKGSLTANGKFHLAATKFKNGLAPADRVKVYEKVKVGIWTYNGLFELVDSWRETQNNRQVFKFKLVLVDEPENNEDAGADHDQLTRVIPSWVKQAVWKRDQGKCRQCGATNDLHFDHILPWSKGGSSRIPENIQLLCARHNLQKHAKIE
ncbi:MAG: HNH endonuclease [Deltaproteobacteria bacterium]|nr:HNH endonuclease [Deltaproteobacteria bacterium]MCB9478425.1 HNH endonuclease [Deltaproteobacteria bacterium]